MEIKFRLNVEELAQLYKDGFDELVIIEPQVKNSGIYGDVGIDLFCPTTHIVQAFSQAVINTYFQFDFPPGYFGLLRPRGGDKFMIGSGVIDPGFTGSVRVRIVNYTENDMVFKPGSSVGQMVLLPTFVDGITLKIATEIPEKTRGNDGRILVG